MLKELLGLVPFFTLDLHFYRESVAKKDNLMTGLWILSAMAKTLLVIILLIQDNMRAPL